MTTISVYGVWVDNFSLDMLSYVRRQGLHASATLR